MRRIAIWKIVILILIQTLLTTALAFARAGGSGGGGGGGGGGFSGGSSGGGGGTGWTPSSFAGYLLYAILWVIMGLVIYKMVIKALGSVNKLSQDKVPFEKKPGYEDFIKSNFGFSLELFKQKVKIAFIAIQDAWSAQNLSQVRRFISDGVYQRFSTQFRMMSLLQQKNPLSEIEVEDIHVIGIETDGRFDTLHVLIAASMYDRFICQSNPKLNSPGGNERFKEIWSLIKRRGENDADIYSSNVTI